ncbi:MAG: tRNA (N6-threonylcarbamoyladenosine(37)-N6)-methyltransferase TrmO [Desulfobacterales bacterium]|jgi:tRNA-Thr(GGU) m(6)t(6)A37 methyltransferase TsaA
MSQSFYLNPVGIVRKSDGKIWIDIYNEYMPALLGLEGFSHINVMYWFHRNDTAKKRKTLRVHPRGDQNNPLTGVFATHSPLRPNLIALTLCKIIAIQRSKIEIEDIDADEGSPVVDIKCYIPNSVSASDVRLPDWV